MALPTRDDVAAWLGIPAMPEDDRLTQATDAGIAWVMGERSVTVAAVGVEGLFASPAVSLGAVIYASLLYGSRAQPQGFAGFDALGVYSDDVGMSIHRVYQLVGRDPVFA